MMISLLAALAASGALAGAQDPDGVIATGARETLPIPTESELSVPASPVTTTQDITPHGLSTDEQIARWISARTAETAELPGDPWERREERRMRGEVSVGVGTGGYRDYSAAVSMPLGENGQLNLSVSQTKNAPYLYEPYGYSPYYGGGYWDSPYWGRRMVDAAARRPQTPSVADVSQD